MKVLVVIDMQNDFITGSLANPVAEKVVPKIVDHIDKFDGDMIVATLDTHNENYLDTYEGRHLPIKHCIKDTNGWCLDPEIAGILLRKSISLSKGVETVYKPYFNGAQEICNVFQNNFICPDIIEVVGTVTEICVISNILGLKALYPNAEFIVYADMCAGLTEEGHKAALEVMKACQVQVVGE